MTLINMRIKEVFELTSLILLIFLIDTVIYQLQKNEVTGGYKKVR